MAHRHGEPPNDGRNWVTTEEAAAMVGISLDHFRQQVIDRQLTRYRPPSRRLSCWFLRAEIEAWAEFVTLRKRWRTKHRLFPGTPQVEKIELALAKEMFIPSTEVVRILDITRSTLHGLVRRGRLFAYQARPGCRGSRLWFSRRAVEQLRSDPKRARRRAGYLRGQKTLEARRSRREAEVHEKPFPCEQADNCGWLTSQQVAARLGVRRNRVCELHRTGRLHGEPLRGRSVNRRALYFHYAEVEALLADPGYRKFRALYEVSHSPEQEAQRQAERLAVCVRANARYHDEFMATYWGEPRW